MNWAKTKVIGGLTGLVGVLVTPLISTGIVALVAQVERFSPELAAQIPQADLRTWLSGLIVAVISYFAVRPIKGGVKEIQREANEALPKVSPIPEDGIPLARTKGRIRAVVARANPKTR